VGVVLGSSFWAWIYCFQEVCVVGNFVLVSEKSWVASKRQRDGLHPNWTAPMTMTAPPLDEDDDMLVPPQDFNDGIEAMEVVGQGETVSTVDNHPADNPQTGKFTWTLDHFSKINLRKHYSECFMVGGYKW
jgi:hypothetical protein